MPTLIDMGNGNLELSKVYAGSLFTMMEVAESGGDDAAQEAA